MFKSQAMADRMRVRDPETVPPSGRVSEMCQEWMVREDGALAHRLQDQEINQHYTGNKHRNQLVREDLPHAKSAQAREQEMAEQAAAIYHRMLEEQELVDAEVARQLALQEKQRGRHQRRVGAPQPLPDDYTVPYEQTFRKLNLNNTSSSSNEDYERRLQEAKDAQLARQLQAQEADSSPGATDQLNRDRMVAIEAQDKELAKMLQERERIKMRKARDKARQKALAKKSTVSVDDSYATPVDANDVTTTYVAPNQLDYSQPADLVPKARINKPRYPDPEDLGIPVTAQHVNIAMAIDPTYKESPKRRVAKENEPKQQSETDDVISNETNAPAPPYMPIQGQRRTASLEKKHKKKANKDKACKQQ